MTWLAGGGASLSLLYGAAVIGKLTPSGITMVLIEDGPTRIMFSPLSLKICSRSWPGR